MGDFSPVHPHGRDGHLFGIKRTVLAAVDHFPVPGFALEEGAPHKAVELGGMPAGLENAGVLAHRLGGAVAGHPGKCRVDPEDVAGAVGDGDAVGGGLDSGGEEAQLSFIVFALRDVADDFRRANDPALSIH
jgi:hypothetical protein